MHMQIIEQQFIRLTRIHNPTLEEISEIMTCQDVNSPEALQRAPDFLRLVTIHQMPNNQLEALRQEYFPQNIKLHHNDTESLVKHYLCIGQFDEAINLLYESEYIDGEEKAQLLNESTRRQYIETRPRHESAFMQSIYMIFRGYEPEIQRIAEGNWRYLQMLKLQFKQTTQDHSIRIFKSEFDHLLYKANSQGFELMKELFKLHQPTLLYATFLLLQKQKAFRYLLPSFLANLKRAILYELLKSVSLSDQTKESLLYSLQQFLKGSENLSHREPIQESNQNQLHSQLQITPEQTPKLVEKWFKEQISQRQDNDYLILNLILSLRTELSSVQTRKQGNYFITICDQILQHSFQQSITFMDKDKRSWPNVLNTYLNIGNHLLNKQVKRYIYDQIDKDKLEQYEVDILIDFLTFYPNETQSFKKRLSIIALKCQNVEMIKKYQITYYPLAFGDKELANVIVKMIGTGFVKFLKTLKQEELTNYKSLLSIICAASDDETLESKRNSLRMLIVKL